MANFKRYVVGYMFNDNVDRVVLIRKNRPDWQKGKTSGIGGHVEFGESIVDAMVREYYEETGVRTFQMDWSLAATLHFEYAVIDFFAARNTYYFIQSTTKTDESIVKCLVRNVSSFDPIHNVPNTIELAMQRLSDIKGKEPQSKYNKGK